MSTRKDFINDVKRALPGERVEMPKIECTSPNNQDRLCQFIEMSEWVGGKAVVMNEGEDINALIRQVYPHAAKIASHLPGITIATVNPDMIDDPHLLADLDLAVIEGEIGVAENGCVWIPQRMRQKVICFIPEFLVIILDRHQIVATMHEAYAHISEQKPDYPFGVFISGPSKTADIEQSLVVGAHGARGVTVVVR